MFELNNDDRQVERWFPLLEELGELTFVRFGVKSPNENNTQWIDLPHAKVDGIGGMIQLIRERYNTEVNPPINRSKKRIVNWKIFCGIYDYLKDSMIVKTKWNYPNIEGSCIASTVFSIAFSSEELLSLKIKARNESISLNSLLLFVCDKTLRTKKIHLESVVRWLIPTNMRGVVRTNDLTSNLASYISCHIRPDDTADKVHKQIAARLINGYPLVCWYFLQIGRLIGESGMRKILRRNHDRKLAWLGTFTNFGEWQIPSDDRIYVCPPATRNAKLAIGAVVVNDRLTISLQVHSNLKIPFDVQLDFMESYKKELITFGEHEYVTSK